MRYPVAATFQAIETIPFKAWLYPNFTKCGRLRQRQRERLSDHLAYQALPPAEEMAKILRYESRVQKQLDWALQRLLECQQRRSQ